MNTKAAGKRKVESFKLEQCSPRYRIKEQFDHWPCESIRVWYKIHMKEPTQLSVVSLDNNSFCDGLNYFMIDSGSQLNLIQESALTPRARLNRKKIYHLTGIGEGETRAYGKVVIPIKEVEI